MPHSEFEMTGIGYTFVSFRIMINWSNKKYDHVYASNLKLINITVTIIYTKCFMIVQK